MRGEAPGGTLPPFQRSPVASKGNPTLVTPPSYVTGDRGPRVRSPSYLPGAGRKDRKPAPAEEWLKSRYLSGRLWDTFWRDETREAFCSIVDSPDVEEVILDGSIGWGKSHFARALVMRWVYELTCLASPGETFLSNPTAQVKMALMSVKQEKAREVLFDRLKGMIDRVPYFEREAKYNDDWDTSRLLTSLVFRECGLRVEPVVSNIGSVISDDLICFVLDEANFLPRVQNSKRALDAEAAARVGDGAWSAAREFVSKARTRMRSRFLKGGRCWAKLLVLSSSIDDNDFTLERITDAEKAGELGTRVRYVSKSIWDGKAPGTYSTETFRVDLGARGRPPRVLRPEEVPAGEVIDVPVDLRTDFVDNPVLAVRELAGRRAAPRNVWLTDDEALKRAWDQERRPPCEPVQFSGELIVDREALVVRLPRVAIWEPRYHPGLPRVAHIDLSSTGDATGISMGCCPEVMEAVVRDRVSGETMSVPVPRVHIDFALQVVPPPGGRIDIIEVEEFLLLMMAMGFDLRLVTFDQFQSERSIQSFERAGIPSRRLSLDRYPEPYGTFRRVLRMDGASLPWSPVLDRELRDLLEDSGTGKVDHPAKGSKDVADSVAGVVHALVHPDYLKWALERTGQASALPGVIPL